MTVVNDIGSIFLPSNGVEDKIIWGLTADGEYSVQSGARLLQGIKSGSYSRVGYDWIWSADIPPKIKFFLWKICQNGLPTKKRLELSHVFLPLECVFCNYHAEDAHHLFISCPYGQVVFEHASDLSIHPSLPRMGSSSCFIEYVCNLKRVASLKDIRFIAIVWWFIWYARNNIIFRQHSISAGALGSMIKTFIQNWEQANQGLNLGFASSPVSQKIASKRPIRTNISWVLPPANYVKLNFDGSKTIDGRTTYGFVIRDSLGNLLLSGASQIAQHYSVLVAEAWGLGEGIRGAFFLGLKNIIIEGDNMSLIQATKRIWKISWSIEALIIDPEKDLGKFESYKIHHVFREANITADWMANRGHSAANLCYWFESHNALFSTIIRKDALRWPVSWIPP